MYNPQIYEKLLKHMIIMKQDVQFSQKSFIYVPKIVIRLSKITMFVN